MARIGMRYISVFKPRIKFQKILSCLSDRHEIKLTAVFFDDDRFQIDRNAINLRRGPCMQRFPSIQGECRLAADRNLREISQQVLSQFGERQVFKLGPAKGARGNTRPQVTMIKSDVWMCRLGQGPPRPQRTHAIKTFFVDSDAAFVIAQTLEGLGEFDAGRKRCRNNQKNVSKPPHVPRGNKNGRRLQSQKGS